MKTINQTILKTTLVSALLINSALASPSWVTTAFWKAPQVSDMVLKIHASQPELNSACEVYGDFVASFEAQGNWPGLSKKVDRIRKTLLPGSAINVVDFEASFSLMTPLQETLDLTNSVNIDQDKEPLPFFNHLKSTTTVSFEEIKSFKIEYVEGKHSLTKFSRELGLSDSEITGTEDQSGNTILKVSGRDVACDLLKGNITLSAAAPSFVRLGQLEMNELEDFYHQKLTPELNRILLSLESVTVKSARLGFQMGRIIDEEINPKDLVMTENQIKNLFDTLFVPKTLDSSANLLDLNKKKVVNLVSSADGLPVNLTIVIE
jgi:hypothetical protein